MARIWSVPRAASICSFRALNTGTSFFASGWAFYAALAEQEREFISARTKAALAEARAKGKKLGGLRDATGRRNAALQANAKARAEKVAGVVQPLRSQGATLREIAEALNTSGVPTARGGRWQASQVKRVLERLSGGPVTETRHIVQSTGYGLVPPQWDARLMDLSLTVTDAEV
jgi:hypothetical protein